MVRTHITKPEEKPEERCALWTRAWRLVLWTVKLEQNILPCGFEAVLGGEHTHTTHTHHTHKHTHTTQTHTTHKHTHKHTHHTHTITYVHAHILNTHKTRNRRNLVSVHLTRTEEGRQDDYHDHHIDIHILHSVHYNAVITITLQYNSCCMFRPELVHHQGVHSCTKTVA